MFAAVIPALKLPRQLTGPYDYAVPDDLAHLIAAGDVVTIPWRGRSIPGIVRELRATPAIDASKVKPLTGLIPGGRVPEELLRTFDWMAEHYVAATATVVKCFLPTVPKRAIKKEEPIAVAKKPRARKGACKKLVIRYATAAVKMSETVTLAEAALASGRSAIILVPHSADVGPTIVALRSACGETNVVAFHGDMTMTKLWGAWRHAASGQPVVVVGTRLAVAAPVTHLGAMIVLESDSGDLKQYDQNPRYDSRSVALRRAAETGADIAFMSHAPRAEEYALVRDHGFTWKEIGLPAAPAEIVLAEPGRGAKTAAEKLFTPTAENAAEEALQSQKRVLLFHNRRGSATALICRDCNRIERCDTCEIPLRVHTNALHCHRCGKKGPLPLLCSGCGGASLRTYGLGTGAVTTALGGTFPDAKIVQLDADERAADISGADIAIGTQLLLHAAAELPDAPQFSAVIMTAVDDLLGHPGFRTTENAWRTVRTLADIAGAAEGRLVLQTFDGENPEIRRLLIEPKTFLAEELASRDKAGYPPNTSLVTVTALAKSESAAKSTIERLVRDLRNVDRSAQVSGPLRPGNPFRHGMWRSLLVIKAKTLSPAMLAALRALSEDCIIDRDPEYLG